jgi:NAD dependent epimerase/dehydratase
MESMVLKNKNIVVTGGCGFIGSHLVEMLIRSGNKVKCFDRYNPNNNWGWLENSDVKEDLEMVLGDIRDYDSVSKTIKGSDIVFHLAALIGIPYSYVSPLAYIRTNIEGTFNVLESAKTDDIEQILITSTSETYGSAQYVPIDENHPLVGQSPYSASKIAADQLATSYFKSFGLKVKIARPFNTYGPRQSARAIIPTIISQILKNDGKINIGSLSPTRDLTYVEDTCRGFISIAQLDDLYGEVMNIGTNSEISIKALIETISNLMQVEVSINIDNNRVRPAESEVDRLVCDSKRILTETDWSPIFTLEKGLLETIDWLKNVDLDSLYKPNQYNV